MRRIKHISVDDYLLRNRLANFYLSEYSLLRALEIIPKKFVIYFLPVSLFLIFPGEFLMYYLFGDACFSGTFPLVLPILIAIIILYYLWKLKLNLFKLFLPRMSLGILIGWTVLLNTEGLWKMTLILEASTIVIIDTVVICIVSVFIYTKIKNRVHRATIVMTIGRTLVIIIFALLISFLQGFYIIQFFGKPMIENSGILAKIFDNTTSDNISSIDVILNKSKEELNDDRDNKTLAQLYSTTFYKPSNNISIKNYYSISFGRPLSHFDFFKKHKIRYIFSILSLYSFISILTGAVFQLVWGDKPMTDPL
ncbi:MAG: hypothetical protein H7844_08665 [Nitrospirae bacterium YQR-1]